MSIAETDKIDGLGVSKQDNKILILLLTDHFIWDDEEAHIWALEDKINAYAGFIESKQYERVYPNRMFEEFVIQICFLYPYPESCEQFLKTATEQLAPLHITFQAKIGS